MSSAPISPTAPIKISSVIVEDGGLHYIIHGDVTYTDEALSEVDYVDAPDD